MWQNQSHEANYLLSHNHLPSQDHPSLHNHPRRSRTEMNIRRSFSRLKNKLERPNSKRKPDRISANSGGERRDAAGSLSQPASCVVVDGGRDQEDKENDTDGQQIRSTDRPSATGVPEPVPAGRSNNGQEGIEGGVHGGEVSQRYLHPHSDIRLAVGSGSGHKGNEAEGEQVGRVRSSPSTPSITLSRKPDGISTIPEHVPTFLRSNESGGPSAGADGNRPDWGSTASATAKLILRGVRDSADAFGPLKSIAGGLCFILENCEVWPSFHILHYLRYL